MISGVPQDTVLVCFIRLYVNFTGVVSPEDTVLGPLLFLLFNDLPDHLNSRTHLFADDCIVYRNIKDVSNCQLLQEALNTLSSWEQQWGMEFHSKVTEVQCSILHKSQSIQLQTEGLHS